MSTLESEALLLRERIKFLENNTGLLQRQAENLQKDKENLEKDKIFLLSEREKLISSYKRKIEDYERKLDDYAVQLGLRSLREVVADLIHAVYNELCKLDPLPPGINQKCRRPVYELSKREKFISENAAILLEKCAGSLGSREISVLTVYAQADIGTCVYGKVNQFHHHLNLGRTISDFKRSVPIIHDKPVEDILMGLLSVLEGLNSRSVFLEFEEAPGYSTITNINKTLVDEELPRNVDGIKKAALVLFAPSLKQKGLARLLVYPPEGGEPVRDIAADLKESSYEKPYRLVIRDDPR